MEKDTTSIRLAKDMDREIWDKYLDKFPLPPLNRYAWKEILEKSYGVKTQFFIAYDKENAIRGILPTYITKDVRGRKKLYSLRFGCVADDKEIKKRLFLHLKDFCKNNNITSNLVTTGYERTNTNFQEEVKKTVVMGLKSDEDSAWRSLRDKTRNMVRKAVRSNLTAERGFHNLRQFYNIYVINMLNKKVPIHSYNFFKDISEKMGDKVELIVAKVSDKVIAGTVVLFSKDIAIYPFQAALADFRRFAPNDFLVWETIKLCLQKKISKLDMGESKEGGNVYRFKTNFGGTPQDIYYYTTFSTREGSGDDRNPKGRVSIQKLNLPFWMKKRTLSWLKKRGRII